MTVVFGGIGEVGADRVELARGGTMTVVFGVAID